MELHIDLETYSSVDIKSSGLYRYMESPDFEIMLIGYALGDGDIRIVDLASGDKIPKELDAALRGQDTIVCAHNATFERRALAVYGFDIPIERFQCSAIKAAYCGYPLALAEVSKAMNLGEKGKLATGKALIKYFCTPCAPSAANGKRRRNFPEHNSEKWELFKEYLYNDVEAEREVLNRLKGFNIPAWERTNYIVDQEINDRGVLIDADLARNARAIDDISAEILKNKVKEITGVENPNSGAQMREWLSNSTGLTVPSLAKGEIPELLRLCAEEFVCPAACEVLGYWQKLSKSSIKKYVAMLNCICDDNRARGLFQFYGATRTGRFAGRLIQLQNLPQNHMDSLELARNVVHEGSFEKMDILYDSIPTVLSELIRTAMIAPEGHTFDICDYSAIEARVLSWIANETWRLEVFKTHGKIYEASASMMFHIPIDQIVKGSVYRQKGKVAELALGYGGALEALRKMGGELMGMTDAEMREVAQRWRKANPSIVAFWARIEECAITTVTTKRTTSMPFLTFRMQEDCLLIGLPSGRELSYLQPRIGKNRFGTDSILFSGMVQETKQWGRIETYGGKLTENVVQAIARDLLMHTMQELRKIGYKMVMHVHDEIIVEAPIAQSKEYLSTMQRIMGTEVPWAKGLPLNADGYITEFYKKD